MSAGQLGAALLFAFVATQAIRDVYLGHLFGTLGIFHVAALAFGTTAVVFGLAATVAARDQLALLARHLGHVVAVGGTTLVAWSAYLASLERVQPVAANLAFAGVAPIAVAAWHRCGLRAPGARRPAPAERALHGGLLLVVVALAGTLAMRGGADGLANATGVLLAAFAGVVITAETIVAKRLNDRGVGPLAIVGVRFLPVAAISAAIVADDLAAASRETIVAGLHYPLMFVAILVGPIYLAQAGLARTSPLVSGVVLSLAPVATLGVQAAAGPVEMPASLALLSTLYAVLAAAAAWFATRSLEVRRARA